MNPSTPPTPPPPPPPPTMKWFHAGWLWLVAAILGALILAYFFAGGSKSPTFPTTQGTNK